MLSKNQIQILNLFRKNPFLKSSILEIKTILKSKSYQRIFEAVKILEKNHILKLEKIGSSNLISLDFTPQSILELSYLDELESINKKLPNFNKIISFKEITQYLIIVTGSYSKGTETKKSDMDLVIIIPDKEKIIDIQKTVENLTISFHPEVHLYVFNNKDFIEMLLDKNENYGKEIFNSHIILKNARFFYELLKEAIDNGFKG